MLSDVFLMLIPLLARRAAWRRRNWCRSRLEPFDARPLFVALLVALTSS